jgi:hypothetical protein
MIQLLVIVVSIYPRAHCTPLIACCSTPSSIDEGMMELSIMYPSWLVGLLQSRLDEITAAIKPTTTSNSTKPKITLIAVGVLLLTGPVIISSSPII